MFGTQKEYKKPNLIPIFVKWELTGLSTTCYSNANYRMGYEMVGRLSDGTRIIVADILTEPDFWLYTDSPDHHSPFRVKRCSPPYKFRHISHLRDLLIRLEHVPLVLQEEHALRVEAQKATQDEIAAAVALFKKMLA